MAEDHASEPRQRAPQIRATVAGNRLTLLETGEERRAAILELIRSSTTSLRLLFYIFNRDTSATEVRDALVEAAARGVKVELLLDGFGCGKVEPGFFGPLAENGGRFCLFHPRYGRRYFVRNHQKLAIADDRRAIIGGANVHDDYLGDGGPKHWRDLWLLVEGDAVRPASAYFDALYRWTTRKGAKLRSLHRLVRDHSQSRGALQWKFSGPVSRRNPWPTSFVRDVQSARHLDIVSCYFSPPRAILRRIGRATGHAVVRIITSGKSDNSATIAAARHNYARMLRRGVQMYEYMVARLHTKLIIVDDIVHIGSANFDLRSFYINLEIMLRIEDAAFAAKMRVYFERELKGSERITSELHNKRGTIWRRMQWTVAHWLVTTMDYTVTRRLNFGPER